MIPLCSLTYGENLTNFQLNPLVGPVHGEMSSLPLPLLGVGEGLYCLHNDVEQLVTLVGSFILRGGAISSMASRAQSISPVRFSLCSSVALPSKSLTSPVASGVSHLLSASSQFPLASLFNAFPQVLESVLAMSCENAEGQILDANEPH